jgi:threonine synthase
MLLGAYRGFRALAEAGWTDRVPRLLAAQAAGHAPVVDRLRGPAAAAGDNDRADGIQIDAPAREHQVLAAIEATDGDAVAIDGAAVDAALDRLHRAGFYTEPTCAVAPAALERFRDEGVLEGDGSDRDGEGEDVVVALSGSGLKT